MIVEERCGSIQKKNFTLIELLVVIAIIVLLMAILPPNDCSDERNPDDELDINETS